MKSLFRLILPTMALFTLALSGCTSSKVFTRPDAPKVDFSKEKLVVMPASIRGLPGDKTKLVAALFGGMASALGKRAIPLQPLQPALKKVGLGGLSGRMGRGIYNMVATRQEYDLKTGGSRLKKIPGLVMKLVKFVSGKMNLKKKPRFLMLANIQGLGRGTLPKTYKYRVIGSIYDSKTDKVHSTTYYKKTTARDLLVAEMATVGKSLVSKLMGGK